MRAFPRKVKGHNETDLNLTGVLAQQIFCGTLDLDHDRIKVAAKCSSLPENEIGIFRLIGCHPHLVHLFEVTKEGDETFLVLELCRGSLDQLEPLEGNNFKTFVGDFVQVVSHLHKTMKLKHGHLTLDHLLMSKDYNRLKICSFSRARVCQNLNELRSDLQQMAMSIFNAPLRERQETVPLNNPAFLVQILSCRSTLSKSDSIMLASLVHPLLAGHTLAEGLENHIFLHRPEDVLRFIDGCKDFLMSRRNSSAEQRLESSSVLGSNWIQRGYLDEMREGRRYDDSVRDLLRLIRNKSEHYNSMPHYIKNCLGHPLVNPAHFLDYFTGLFPGLITWTWHCMYQDRNEANLQAFYPVEGSYLTQVPIEDMIRA